MDNLSFIGIPDKASGRVLSYLSDKELCTVELTCKKLHEVAQLEWTKRAKLSAYQEGTMGCKEWALKPGYGMPVVGHYGDMNITRYGGREVSSFTTSSGCSYLLGSRSLIGSDHESSS